MKKLFLFLLFLTTTAFATNYARFNDVAIKNTLAVGGSTLYLGSSTNSSAIVNVFSSSKGVLLPRMTTTQMNAIGTPATGLTIYNTTASGLYFYNGSTWGAVAGSAASFNTFGASIVTGVAITANTNILYDTIKFDSGSGYNSGTGNYTCPTSGKYLVADNSETTGSTNIFLVLDGVQQQYLHSQSSGAINSGSALILCLGGSTLSVQPGNTVTFNGGTPYQNSISIVGPY